jgi:hypothetical protein
MIRIRPSIASCLLAVSVVPLAGCPVLNVEADVPEVCLTYPNLAVTATQGQGSLSQRFTFSDLSAVHDLASHDASLHFVRAAVRVTSGLTSLAFVDALRVVVSSGDPGTTLPPLTMYDCSGDCVAAGDTLELPAAAGNDAIAYLRSSSLVIDLDFQGTIPAASWTMDVDVCMSARAGYTLSP